MSEYLLKDITELIVDCPHSTANDEGQGYPLVRTPNIGKGRLVYQGMHRVSEEVYNKRNQRAVPQENDLIFAREATAGNVALIQKGEKVCLGQRTVLIRPNKSLVNPAYLTYLLLAPKQQYNLLGTANGATVAHVNLPTIRNLKLELPDLEVQRRIATILSRYDTLIENYQKQIRLLEEAAQRLYKEWFVDLRFPGYESTKIVDGVPEGWEKKKLGEIILKSIGGGWGKDYPQEKFDKEGFVIRGTDISKLKYGNLDEIPFRFHTESNLKERTLCDGDIIFEVSGGSDKDPVGRMYFMTKPILDYYKKDVICASFCKKISFPNKLVSLLCFYAMQYCRNSGDMKKYEKDSAGNIINFAWTTFLENFHMLVPNENFLKNFYKIANANINQQVNISLQIRLLTEARDRLLPRLMGGEINV